MCIAAANAGDTAQDLKTGYLIGATPWKQQVALMFGVVISVFSIGATLNAMNTGLETFQRLPRPIPMNLSALPEGVQDSGHFRRDHVLITTHYGTGRAGGGSPSTRSTGKEELPGAWSFILLNAIGSSTLEDGKYLYNPATGAIEIQWVQGIGSEKAAAPQGRLMATVINGILSRRLPWSLVLLGVALVIAVELLGVRSLTFAVGAYLSIGTTLAIFVGGVMRWMVDRAILRHRARLAAVGVAGTNPAGVNLPVDDPDNPGHATPTDVTPALDTESEISPGSLYASGLIAAGGIIGLLGVVLKLYEAATDHTVPRFSEANPLHHDWVSVLAFGALAFSLYYFARKPLKTE